MDYEKRFKRFVSELLLLIEKHIHEWEKAERDIHDVDEMLEHMEADLDKETQSAIYAQEIKKPAKRKNSRSEDASK